MMLVLWHLNLKPAAICKGSAAGVRRGVRIFRPIDNKPRDDAMSPRYTAEKSGLW
jgi:hypothetical protein